MDRNQGIDSLRGASVIAVMLYHYELFRPVSGYGLYGVLLFFVISGYCMIPSLESSRNAFHFYKKRLIRLLPAFIFCATLTALIEIYLPLMPERSQPLSDVVLNIVCIPLLNLPCSVANAPYSNIDGVYWTLVVEFKFYALLAATYFVSQRHYFYGIAAMAMIGVAGLVVLSTSQNSKFLMFLPFFLAGMSLYELKRNSGKAVVGFLVSAVSYVLYMNIANSESMPLALDSTIAFMVSCVAIFGFSYIKTFPTWSKPVSSCFLYFGAISYPLYLLHSDIGYILIKIAPWWPVVVPAIVTLLSYFVHRYVEHFRLPAFLFAMPKFPLR